MYNFRIDDTANMVFVEFQGEILSKDYERLLLDIISHTKFKKSPRVLIDQSRGSMSIPVEKVQLHPHFIKNIQNELGIPKVAVIVGSDLDYGINRMFEIYSEGIAEFEGKIFRNITEAKKWLNAPS